MVATTVFVALCAATALVGFLVVFRAVTVRSRERKHAKNIVNIPAETRIPPRAAMHKLHWVSASEFSRLITSDPDLVLFHLVDGSSQWTRSGQAPSQLAVSLQQLEETLPWIPYTSRVAIYRNEGIDPALARKLSAVMHGREALLLSGMVPPITEKFDEMAGERCN